MHRMGNKIRENWMFLLLTAAFVLFLLPMLVMCFLAMPAADDFSQGEKIKHLIQQNDSILYYFKNVFALAGDLYQTIQGAFTIDVLIFLNPIAYNIALYPVACVLNFLLLLLSLFILSHCIVKYFLHSTWKNTMYLWMLSTILTTQFVPVAETFYWYAGFVAYCIPFSLLLLFASLLIRMQCRKEKRPLWTILACVLGFLIGGTNYPLALFACCSMAILLASNVFAKKWREALWSFPPFLFLAAGFLINVMAPGNSNRMEYYNQLHPLKAIFESFYSAFEQVAAWLTQTPILFFMLLCVPLMIPIISKIRFRFALPGLLSLLVFCLSAVLFTPGLFAMGNSDIPERYQNMVCMILTWLIIFVFFYWVGWLAQKLDIRALDNKLRFSIGLVACVALFVPLSTRTAQETMRDLGSMVTAEDIVIGGARDYHHTVTELFEQIEASTDEKVLISSYLPETKSLHRLILDNDRWEIHAMRQFFDKDIIVD